jgi:hypothetical protein
MGVIVHYNDTRDGVSRVFRENGKMKTKPIKTHYLKTGVTIIFAFV